MRESTLGADGGPAGMTDASPRPLPEALVVSAKRAEGRGLCGECFGRLYGRWEHGLTNPGRTEVIAAGMGAGPPGPDTECPLCGGLFARLPVWVDRCLRAADGYEWHRFTCGSRWEPELLAREESLWTEVGTEWGESIRAAFNRELGKAIEARTGASGGTTGADLVFLADLPVGRVETTILPVYVQGRYRKLDRSLPQTRWPCRRCGGRGCDTCHGTGKTYPESVEEIVAAPFLTATGGTGSRFHGMGREDIDARMLGRGRPFVLEILRPHHRTVDLSWIAQGLAEKGAGRVEVIDLAPADASDVLRVKEANPEKSYRVGVLGAISVAKVNEALDLALARAIAQRTPTRVAHRRSDRVRTRRIVSARLVDSAEGRFTLDLRTEAGTYVKEWVEGDGGRTEPSLAALVGVPLKVDFLDVMEIHDSSEDG
jgi:tRNA pseudouridine synthase 10